MTIGRFCGDFRTNVLKLMLKDLAPNNIKALSAFENGRSSNMHHLTTYFNRCDATQEEQFVKTLAQALKEIKNGN